jgi:diketogulonate reductase-like aldo/keto reductase
MIARSILLTIQSCIRLNNGVEIPRLGLGVYQSPPGRITRHVVSYANTFGATLTAAIINANSVEKIDCINVINPAIKTVFVKRTLEVGGISIFFK